MLRADRRLISDNCFAGLWAFSGGIGDDGFQYFDDREGRQHGQTLPEAASAPRAVRSPEQISRLPNSERFQDDTQEGAAISG